MFLYDNAVKYARDVVSGKEITTKEVIIQCKWFLRDLERVDDEDFDFYFDLDKLKVINNLLELMNFATGFVAGKQVLKNLAGFQCFLIANIFGWRFKNNPDKFRYNDITVYIARKNAKTVIVAIIFILLMLTEQNYSEFYSICLNRELAGEIKKHMQQVLEASPLLYPKHFKISKNFIGNIECKLTNSFYQPRTAESGKNNTIRPAAFVSDEHANFKDNANFQAMRSGQKNVINPLRFRTTTAYAVDDSIMESDLEYIKKVFCGLIKNERQFALLYYAGEKHLWDDYGMYQANPLRIEDNYETIREDREKALEKEDEVEEYLTKSMNYFMPENSGEAFIDIDHVRKCKLKDSYDWTNKDVYVGLDLAETEDNTAISMITYDEILKKVICKSFAFIPKARVESKSRKEHVDYNIEIKKETCFACGNEVVDYGAVENFVLNIEKKYKCKVKQIGYDRRNALSSAQKFENEKYDCVEVVQHSSILHPTIKWLKELILNQDFAYEENKLLEINFVNARCTEDTNKNKYLNKKKSKGKIDIVMSAIDALYLLLQEQLVNVDYNNVFNNEFKM